MNTFTLSPHGEQHRLQHADPQGNGTHIICELYRMLTGKKLEYSIAA